MKTILSLSSVLFISIIFTSCIKTVEIATPPVSNSVEGSWYINNASVDNGYGWNNFNAQLPGVFNFYNDGSATYSDDLGNMRGYWSSNFLNTDYYDAHGTYQTNGHKDFNIDISSKDGGYIKLYFDDISFSGNDQFTTTYYDGKTLERYTFSRY